MDIFDDQYNALRFDKPIGPVNEIISHGSGSILRLLSGTEIPIPAIPADLGEPIGLTSDGRKIFQADA